MSSQCRSTWVATPTRPASSPIVNSSIGHPQARAVDFRSTLSRRMGS
jgi:hypothetical protein